MSPRIVASYRFKYFEKIMIFFYFKNKRCKTFCIVIDNVLSIVINIQNTTIFEPVILAVLIIGTLNHCALFINVIENI